MNPSLYRVRTKQHAKFVIFNKLEKHTFSAIKIDGPKIDHLKCELFRIQGFRKTHWFWIIRVILCFWDFLWILTGVFSYFLDLLGIFIKKILT